MITFENQTSNFNSFLFYNHLEQLIKVTMGNAPSHFNPLTAEGRFNIKYYAYQNKTDAALIIGVFMLIVLALMYLVWSQSGSPHKKKSSSSSTSYNPYYPVNSKPPPMW